MAVVLGVDIALADQVVEVFNAFVAEPLRMNLTRLTGRGLAKRNPMIYTARGVTDVGAWVESVLGDKETSAIEGHLGTWQEEVARIISGGIKPAGGVDLQVEGHNGVIELYAIQAAPNTKNAGSRKADIDALKRCAAPLRAARRHVELNVAVLHGRARTTESQSEPGIRMVGSDEFWSRMSGVSDFRARLLRATMVLADLIREQSTEEVSRIRAEARAIYDDGTGALNVEALANPPKRIAVDQSVQLALLTETT